MNSTGGVYYIILHEGCVPSPWLWPSTTATADEPVGAAPIPSGRITTGSSSGIPEPSVAQGPISVEPPQSLFPPFAFLLQIGRKRAEHSDSSFGLGESRPVREPARRRGRDASGVPEISCSEVGEETRASDHHCALHSSA